MENIAEEPLFSYFADILPPSVNIRLGIGKRGNLYKNREYTSYAKALILRLKAYLRRDSNTLPEKSLYRIELFFLAHLVPERIIKEVRKE